MSSIEYVASGGLSEKKLSFFVLFRECAEESKTMDSYFIVIFDVCINLTTFRRWVYLNGFALSLKLLNGEILLFVCVLQSIPSHLCFGYIRFSF